VRFWIDNVLKTFHSGERIQKVADSYAGFTGQWTEAVSGIACSRLSDSGEGAKEWRGGGGRRECERHAKTGAGRKIRKFLPFLFSCSRFLNSADPTISQPGTGYIRKEKGACGFKNIRIHVTGPQEASIIPTHRRCLVIHLGHRLSRRETAISS